MGLKVDLALYKKMYLIRRAEKAIIEEYKNDEMKTPMHMSLGEEAIVAGVCQAFQGSADFFGTYRSHGLYLAVTEETDRFFAEMYGRADGVARGKSGSMHLASPEHGLIMTSAVVGTTIPVALGWAYRNRIRNNNRISVVFFGDGAVDEGVFWESINLAQLKGLPVLFVYEDNDLAIHTSAKERHCYDALSDIISKFTYPTFEFRGTAVNNIYELARRAHEAILTRKGPAFISLRYYRYLEHVGVNDDLSSGYRTAEEAERWKNLDPVNTHRELLCQDGNLTEVENIEKQINEQVLESLKKAQDLPFASVEELTRGVFSE